MTPGTKALVRRKRNHAAHEILFYLGLVRRCGLSWIDRHAEKERAFTLRQVDARIKSIAELAGTGSEEQARWEALVRAAIWKHERDPDDEWVGKVWRAAAAYLRLRERPGRNRGVGLRWSYRLYANLATLIAVGGTLYAVRFVEQVRALWHNADATILAAVVGCIAGIPLVAVTHSLWTARGGARVSVFDLGRPSLWFSPAQPRPPTRGVDRFGGSELPRRIYLLTLLRALPWAGGTALALLCTRLSGDPANTTALMALALFAALIAAARVLDVWDFVAPIQLRLAVLALVGGGILSVLQSSRVYLFLAALGAVAWSVGYPVLCWFRDQRKSPGARRPFRRPEHSGRLVVAAVALGVLALALVGARTAEGEDWERDPKAPDVARIPAEDWPLGEKDPVVVMIASGGGSRAALYAALTLEALHRELEPVACNIQAISSVSGGSLTNAIYTRLRVHRETDPCSDASVKRGWLADLVTDDFVRPTMLGVFHPFKSRGRMVEEAFEETDDGRPRVGRDTISSVVRAWEQGAATGRPLPVPLFNSARTDGHDLVISPLSRVAYTDMVLRDHATGESNAYASLGGDTPTWVYYRDGIYGLEDVLPGRDASLAEAVRASANFPFGFPPIRIRTDLPSWFSPVSRFRKSGKKKGDAHYIIKVTDGGVLSNSGMWPMFHLLRNRVDALRSRGVLLLIVEASKMPPLESDPSILDAHGDQVPIAASLHRRLLEFLGHIYGGRLVVAQLDLPALESHNVMTTWVLPRLRIDELRRDFGRAWKRARPRIESAWDGLRGAPGAALPERPIPIRLPVD